MIVGSAEDEAAHGAGRAYGRAAEVLQRAAGLVPRDRAVQNDLGLALGGLGRDEEALAAFLRAGDAQAAHNNLGTAQVGPLRPPGAEPPSEHGSLAPPDPSSAPSAAQSEIAP